MVMPINGFMRTPPRVLKLSTDVLQRASIRKLVVILIACSSRFKPRGLALAPGFTIRWNMVFYSIFGEACQRDIQI